MQSSMTTTTAKLRKRFGRLAVSGLVAAMLAVFVPHFMHASAAATTVGHIADVAPTSWKLQDMPNGDIFLWNAGSSCHGGSLVTDETFGQEARGRLQSLILAAKMKGARVFIDYTNDGADTCHITSFGMATP